MYCLFRYSIGFFFFASSLFNSDTFLCGQTFRFKNINLFCYYVIVTIILSVYVVSGLLLDISVFSFSAQRTVLPLSLKILYLLRIKLNELNISIRCSHLINQNKTFAYERLTYMSHYLERTLSHFFRERLPPGV